MERDASSSHSSLPTTLCDPLQPNAVQKAEKLPTLVSHLLREEKPVPEARSMKAGVTAHLYLGVAGTARSEELGDLAGRAGYLRMVLQSLWTDLDEQEDLQSLQGLVGPET